MRNIVTRVAYFVSVQSGSANSDWLGVGLTLSHPDSEN